MNVNEKIKRLGLLPIDTEQIQKLNQYYLSLPDPVPHPDYAQWDFVVWCGDEPVFYSRQFIEETDVEIIETFLAWRAMENATKSVLHVRDHNYKWN